jgi:RecQ family ATP-dependent DNA helicase
MSAVDFDTRARELVERIDSGGLDEETAAAIALLRDRWRELSGPERAGSAAAAQALADAQRRATRPYDGPADPDALLAHFGLEAFRPGQREAVEAALAGRDSLIVMPTGGGKSLCYQLPAIARPTLTVVVSPLIALMHDQYRRLVHGGHPAAMIASGMEPGAAARALTRVRDGEARLVLCSPERFASTSFLSALEQRRVGLFVVDEAHCLSEWGHDFRPDYLRLRGVIERLGSPPVMACTATATEQVAEEIVGRLALRDPLVLRAGFDRPNLSFDVIPLDGAGMRARKLELVAGALTDPDLRPAIVYCGTRREVEAVRSELAERGLAAVGYHAGMAADQRAGAQRRFMDGDAEVVVATNAFGMGVDKANVRAVIHWSIPTSVEAYYQEAGRGGRDGQSARAILLASRADLGRLLTFIREATVQPGDVLRYVGGLAGDDVVEAPRDDRERICLGIAERAGLVALEPAPGGRLRISRTGRSGGAEVAAICRAATDRSWRAYHAVERFSSSTDVCRRRMLLDHFGDPRATRPLHRCCDVCDPGTIGLRDPGLAAARPRAAAIAPDALAEDDRPLFDALRAWRAEASDGKPAYTVAHNATLAAIASTRPQSLAELAAIRGVGPSFIERHGARVLEVVQDGWRATSST